MSRAGKPRDLFALFVVVVAKRQFRQYESYYFTQCKS